MKKAKVILLFLLPLVAEAQGWSELGGLNGLGLHKFMPSACTYDTLPGPGVDEYIINICISKSGNVYVAGNFSNESGNNYLAHYSGRSWTKIELKGASAAIGSDTGENIYAGAYLAYTDTNGEYNQYLTKLNGPRNGVLDSFRATHGIYSLCHDASGNMYAACCCKGDSGENYSYLIKFNTNSFTEIVGLKGNGFIHSICCDPNGNVYAAGDFTKDSAQYSWHYVAKYDGKSWSQLGEGIGFNRSINSICSDTKGNIYAAGRFTNKSYNYYVAKFDGKIWTELGGSNGLNANYDIQTICSDTAGNIYAAGSFTNDSGQYYVAKYNGTSWAELGGANGLNANNEIESVCSDIAGNIYAAGVFTNSAGRCYVAKYSTKKRK